MSTPPTANDVGSLAVMHAYRGPGETRPYPGQAIVTTLWYTDFTRDGLLRFVAEKWASMDGQALQGARSLEGLRQIWELAAFAIGIPYRDEGAEPPQHIQEALL